MKCANCGADVRDDVPFCSECGRPLREAKPLKKNTARLVIIEVAPTAARASLPTKLPTTMVSAVLYII